MNIDIDKAVGLLEARMKDNPKSLVFARLADLYLDQGRVEDALAICIESTKVHPDYATGHFVLAKAYIAQKDLEKAETALKKVLSHDQQYPAAQKLLGDILCKTNRDSLAIGHYEAVILMDPLEEKVQKALDRIPREPAKPTPEPSSSPAPKKAESAVRPRIQPASEPQDESWVDQIKEFRPEDNTKSVEERQTFASSENEIADPFADLDLFDDKGKNESPETPPKTGDEDMQTFIQETAKKPPDAEPTDSEAGPIIGETPYNLRHRHEDSPVPLHFSESLSEPTSKLDLEQTSEPATPASPSPDMPISSQAKTTELFPETELEAEEPPPKDVDGFHVFYNEPGILDDASLAAEPTLLDDFAATQKPPPTPPPVEPPVEEIESDLSSIFAEPLPPTPSKPPAPVKTEAKAKAVVKPESEPETAESTESGGEKKLPKIVTPTLGEIYAAQGQFEKAVKVYETLLEKNPNEKKYLTKIEEMKKRIKEASGR